MCTVTQSSCDVSPLSVCACADSQDLFGFANTYYWGMAVGSPFAFVALFVHPVIVDKVNSWIARGLWTLLVSSSSRIMYMPHTHTHTHTHTHIHTEIDRESERVSDTHTHTHTSSCIHSYHQQCVHTDSNYHLFFDKETVCCSDSLATLLFWSCSLSFFPRD